MYYQNYKQLKKSIKIRGNIYDLSSQKVMGILNLSPDSFYKESRAIGEKEIEDRVEQMIMDGVDIIDIGGCSSRPGAESIPL